MRRSGILLLIVCCVLGLASLAQARTQPPGSFAQGRVRVGFYGGIGSTLNQSYGILGGGLGYYLLDGLEAGLDYEAWIGNSPTIQKITPQLRYVVWQLGHFKPYGGVFWRHTTVSDDWPDYDSWGLRGGLAYQSGRNYVALGVVYEMYNGTDVSDTYPEIAFWFTF